MAPPWVTITGASENKILIVTSGHHPSGEPLRHYQLSVAVEPRLNNGLLAREIDGMRLLPSNCMQRHMNTDGSFCIGLGAPWLVVDQASAERWWSQLLGYLRCQDIADITRNWPPNRGLSHGEAGDIQLKAEVLAEKLGLLVQYREAVEYGAEWPPMGVDDSEDYLELLELERRRVRLDQEFKVYIDYPCCNTMDKCPISKAEQQ